MLTTNIRPEISALPPRNSAAESETISDLELPGHLGRNVAMKRDQAIFWVLGNSFGTVTTAVQ